MGQTFNYNEKRQHKRMIIRDKVYAVISPNWIMPYQVIDISGSGLAFRYSGKENLPEENLQLDLFDDNDLCLKGLPARIVSDAPMQELSVPMRRCGLQFGQLDEAQQGQLREFLVRHTIECSVGD